MHNSVQFPGSFWFHSDCKSVDKPFLKGVKLFMFCFVYLSWCFMPNLIILKAFPGLNQYYAEAKVSYKILSRDMRFLTMWYVGPAKAQTILCIREV